MLCNSGQNVYIGNNFHDVEQRPGSWKTSTLTTPRIMEDFHINAVVGNGCRLGNSVSVFSHVELQDFVFCAPFMVFTHISFPRAAVNRRAAFLKTIVKTGVTLGANATVVPGITIGEGTFLAAGSTLTRDTQPWSLMIGVPARQVGWVSAFGEKIPLPLEGSGQWHCPHTGDEYRLDGKNMQRFPGTVDILKYIPGQKLERIQYTGEIATLPADHDLMGMANQHAD